MKNTYDVWLVFEITHYVVSAMVCLYVRKVLYVVGGIAVDKILCQELRLLGFIKTVIYERFKGAVGK